MNGKFWPVFKPLSPEAPIRNVIRKPQPYQPCAPNSWDDGQTWYMPDGQHHISTVINLEMCYLPFKDEDEVRYHVPSLAGYGYLESTAGTSESTQSASLVESPSTCMVVGLPATEQASHVALSRAQPEDISLPKFTFCGVNVFRYCWCNLLVSSLASRP